MYNVNIREKVEKLVDIKECMDDIVFDYNLWKWLVYDYEGGVEVGNNDIVYCGEKGFYEKGLFLMGVIVGIIVIFGGGGVVFGIGYVGSSIIGGIVSVIGNFLG